MKSILISILNLFIFYNLVALTHRGICSIKNETVLYKCDYYAKRKHKNIIHILEIITLNLFVLYYCIADIFFTDERKIINLLLVMPVMSVFVFILFFIRVKLSKDILIYELNVIYNLRKGSDKFKI